MRQPATTINIPYSVLMFLLRDTSNVGLGRPLGRVLLSEGSASDGIGDNKIHIAGYLTYSTDTVIASSPFQVVC